MSPVRPPGPPGSRRLSIRNQQRDCPIDPARLRSLVRCHLEAQLELNEYDLAIHLLAESRMARMNEAHLGHAGSTDVITFDYAGHDRRGLHGELLICPAVARAQARTYRTTWQQEIARYILHGILHLRGFDDRTAAQRRVMKREEDRLLRGLARRQPLRRLHRSKAAA